MPIGAAAWRSLRFIVVTWVPSGLTCATAMCWSGDYTAALCCEPPRGRRECWSSPHYSYRRLNRSVFARAPIQRVQVPRLTKVTTREIRRRLLSVDLVCRTHSGHKDMLLELLRSAEMYWKPLGWGAVVVLDAENPVDVALCSSQGRAGGLPFWVRCALEPPPLYFSKYLPVRRHDMGWRQSSGFVRAHYGHFRFDLYSQADYLAVIDADVVFFTYALPQFLFRWGNVTEEAHASHRRGPKEPRPRPVVHGVTSDRTMFGNGLAALRLQRIAEFMPHPFLVRWIDFAAAREFIISRFPGDHKSGGDFETAFVKLQKSMHQISLKRGMSWDEAPCFQTIMGHFLWHYRRGQYAFAIKYGYLKMNPEPVTAGYIQIPDAGSAVGLPAGGPAGPTHSCPGMRVAIDIGGKVKTADRDKDVKRYRAQAMRVSLSTLCSLSRRGPGGGPSRVPLGRGAKFVATRPRCHVPQAEVNVTCEEAPALNRLFSSTVLTLRGGACILHAIVVPKVSRFYGTTT